jgi:hypothetical protein
MNLGRSGPGCWKGLGCSISQRRRSVPTCQEIPPDEHERTLGAGGRLLSERCTMPPVCQ